MLCCFSIFGPTETASRCVGLAPKSLTESIRSSSVAKKKRTGFLIGPLLLESINRVGPFTSLRESVTGSSLHATALMTNRQAAVRQTCGAAQRVCRMARRTCRAARPTLVTERERSKIGIFFIIYLSTVLSSVDGGEIC